MGTKSDVVVIGAGHNGLVAAILLAKAGWSVTVLERNEVAGGAVRTEEITLPGFRHDVFAANLSAFVGTEFFAEYKDKLAVHGFEPLRTSRPFGVLYKDAGFIGISTDPEQVFDSVSRLSVDDAETWRVLAERFRTVAPHIMSILRAPMPSLATGRALIGGTRALGRSWPLDLARFLAQSSREFAEEHFERREMQGLLASWGMHQDFGPDVSGGAVFGFLETFGSATRGQTLGRGGASSLIDALCSLLRSYGGQLHFGAEVERVAVVRGRATAALVKGGERYEATRAVIANVTPADLYCRMLAMAEIPAGFRESAMRFRFGPGTLMLHLALDDLPTWSADSEARTFSYLHIEPDIVDMSLAYHQALAGMLPAKPKLLVSQPTSVDATRAPAEKHLVAVQVRPMPATIVGDAAGEIDRRDWDEAKEPYGDRVIEMLERYAPGLRGHVLGRAVLSPNDLQSWNPNLVGGDSLAGSHHLMQLLLRPFPAWNPYRTPIDALYLCGASTWPGAGLGAGSGTLLAQQLSHTRRRRLRRRPRPS